METRLEMQMNLARYASDLDALLQRGSELLDMLLADVSSKTTRRSRTVLDQPSVDSVKELAEFGGAYQAWYSEAKSVVRQLLPDRLADFVCHYEKPRSRKHVTYEDYTLGDYLQGVRLYHALDDDYGRIAAAARFQQQLAIVRSVKARFESSLFEIRQLVQADLFDSELDAASELAKKGFVRAAGAIAGVVLERHLSQVCENHGISVTRKKPSIADFNELLKNAGVVEIPQWRYIQHLADIRNLCDHNKATEPTAAQVDDLVTGVIKVTKTLY